MSIEKKMPKDDWILGKTLIERCNVDAIPAILANPERIELGERIRFVRYVADSLAGEPSGQLSRTYRRKEYGLGRYIAEKETLGTLNRHLRASLANGIYVDIDMVNAHPHILRSLCLRHGWPHEALDHYIAEREAVLESLQVDRRTGKRIMLALMFGCNLPRWLKDHNIQAQITPFIESFHRELHTLAERARQQYSHFAQVAEQHMRSDNKLFSGLALLLQHNEAEALRVAVQVAEKHGFGVGVLVYDGFMVYAKEEHKNGVPDSLLTAMREAVQSECDLDISFEVKEFDSPLDVSQPEFSDEWSYFY